MTLRRHNSTSRMPLGILTQRRKGAKAQRNADRGAVVQATSLWEWLSFFQFCRASLRLCVFALKTLSRTASFRVGLLLLLAARVVCAETADDFFHGGAMNYFSNNVPQALAVVTNGRAQFPDDVKLKKLEELLKQQQQQQQDQQKLDQEKKEQDKKDQQQKDQQKKDGQDKQQKDQQKPQPDKPSKPDKQKSDQQKQQEAKATPAGQMTPEQAKRLLDSQKGEESALVFRPPEKPKDESKPVKDW